MTTAKQWPRAARPAQLQCFDGGGGGLCLCLSTSASASAAGPWAMGRRCGLLHVGNEHPARGGAVLQCWPSVDCRLGRWRNGHLGSLPMQQACRPASVPSSLPGCRRQPAPTLLCILHLASSTSLSGSLCRASGSVDPSPQDREGQRHTQRRRPAQAEVDLKCACLSGASCRPCLVCGAAKHKHCSHH